MTEQSTPQSDCEQVTLNLEAVYTNEQYAITYDIAEQPEIYYTGFKVTGSSMFDNSPGSLREGDRLICRPVERKLWNKKLLSGKQNFVIVFITGGIFVRRIKKYSSDLNTITVHALNPEYPDKEIDLNNIIQLFRVEQIIRNGEI